MGLDPAGLVFLQEEEVPRAPPPLPQAEEGPFEDVAGRRGSANQGEASREAALRTPDLGLPATRRHTSGVSAPSLGRFVTGQSSQRNTCALRWQVTVGPGQPVIQTKYSGDLVILGWKKRSPQALTCSTHGSCPGWARGAGGVFQPLGLLNRGWGSWSRRSEAGTRAGLCPCSLPLPSSLSFKVWDGEVPVPLAVAGFLGWGLLVTPGLGLCGPLLSQHESVTASTRPRNRGSPAKKMAISPRRRWSWVGGIPQQGPSRAGRWQRVGTPTPGRGQSGGSSSGGHADMCSALSSFGRA